MREKRRDYFHIYGRPVLGLRKDTKMQINIEWFRVTHVAVEKQEVFHILSVGVYP
jgi:hypothetical protein